MEVYQFHKGSFYQTISLKIFELWDMEIHEEFRNAHCAYKNCYKLKKNVFYNGIISSLQSGTMTDWGIKCMNSLGITLRDFKNSVFHLALKKQLK